MPRKPRQQEADRLVEFDHIEADRRKTFTTVTPQNRKPWKRRPRARGVDMAFTHNQTGLPMKVWFRPDASRKLKAEMRQATLEEVGLD